LAKSALAWPMLNKKTKASPTKKLVDKILLKFLLKITTSMAYIKK